jgi:acetolactate synthase-1/2/3 large subunit
VLAAGAGRALLALAEALIAPVVMSRNGKGAIPASHPLAFSSLATRQLIGAADAVLVVGSRFLTGRGQPIATPADATTVLVNADPVDLGPPRLAQISLQADARLALEQLLNAVQPAPANAPVAASAEPFWSPRRLAPIRESCDGQVEAAQPQWSFVRALREAIPEDGILVNELTQVGYVASVAYPVYRPGTFITPGYQGTLGYGYPTALGAKIGSPAQPVVSINGDGGFGYNLQELATARRYGIAVTAVIFNDNAYGNVRSIQAEEFGGRFIGCELANPDFVRMAEAFGVPATRVDTPGRLTSAVKDALTEPGPVLIEVPVGDMPSPWPMLLGGPPGAVRS